VFGGGRVEGGRKRRDSFGSGFGFGFGFGFEGGEASGDWTRPSRVRLSRRFLSFVFFVVAADEGEEELGGGQGGMTLVRGSEGRGGARGGGAERLPGVTLGGGF
jgi:hypothetical protein